MKAAIGPWRAHDAPASTRLDAALSCGWSGHSPLGLTLAGSRADGETDKLMGRNGKTTLLMPRDDSSGHALAYTLWRSHQAVEG